MSVETADEVAALRRIGRIVAGVLKEMLDAAKPGMTILELDSPGLQLLQRQGARSAPRLTDNFPCSACNRITEEAVHGIPVAEMIRPATC